MKVPLSLSGCELLKEVNTAKPVKELSPTTGVTDPAAQGVNLIVTVVPTKVYKSSGFHLLASSSPKIAEPEAVQVRAFGT